jgi:hypothetical protein
LTAQCPSFSRAPLQAAFAPEPSPCQYTVTRASAECSPANAWHAQSEMSPIAVASHFILFSDWSAAANPGANGSRENVGNRLYINFVTASRFGLLLETLRKSRTERKPPESAATLRTYPLSARSLPAVAGRFSSVKNVAGSMTTSGALAQRASHGRTGIRFALGVWIELGAKNECRCCASIPRFP